VNTQAQSDAFTLTAEKAIDLQSTAANVVISAPSKIMLNGAGGYIKIEGGDIEIGTSGNAAFLASMKELTGGNSLHTVALSFPHNNLQLAAHAQQQSFVTALLLTDDEGFVLPNRPYRIWLSNGQFIDGISDENGLTAEINTHTTHVAHIELLKKHGAMA